MSITNLIYKDYKNFCQFFLLLSGDVSLNPGPVQISSTVNVTIWEPLNKKWWHFFHININILLLEIDKLKSIANKINAAITGVTDQNLTILYLISGSIFQGMIFSDVTEIEIVVVLYFIIPRKLINRDGGGGLISPRGRVNECSNLTSWN